MDSETYKRRDETGKDERMKKIIRMTGMILILSGVLCQLFGCAGKDRVQETSEQYVVGVVMKSASSEYWMSVQSGMDAAAAKYHLKTVFLSPDSELHTEVQEKMVERMIKREADALAVAPMDSYEIPDYVDEIEKREIPAVTFDTGFDGQIFPYIGIDNEQTGYELAEVLAKQIDHEGEVGIVAGSLDQMGHRERVEGFRKYMETEPDIDLVFVESGYANLRVPEEKVREILRNYPNVKGIFATSAVTALGLSEATDGKQINIVTVDEQEDALEGLKDGRLSALALQSGYEIGYETIRRLNEMRNGSVLSGEYLIEAEILTKDNVGEYEKRDETEKYSK